jgi:hypothetical protein
MDVNWLRKETSGTTTYYGYSSDVETKKMVIRVGRY